MRYSQDSYAAMLLTLSLSPNKDEYARALSTTEYRDICGRTRNSSIWHIGNLMGVDISGIMKLLSLPEEEAYRIHTLLSRSVPLAYTMESFMDLGISIITEFDEGYPERAHKRAGDAAPPVMYVYGSPETLNQPTIGILGMSGIKTSPEVRESIHAIVEFSKRAGYRIITGGELGVSRVTEGFILDSDADLTCALGGGMKEYMSRAEITRLMEEGRFSALSLEHPDAMFTSVHAITRNKLLISLAEAVFIFNTDMKRGESDALKGKFSDWIYAWNGYPSNHNLIKKGATGISAVTDTWLSSISQHWKNSRSEQMSMF